MKVPIGAVDLPVTHVLRHQCHYIAVNSGAVAAAGLEDPDSESVSKIMDARPGLARARVDSHRSDQT